ncbi:FxSxx-COOH system tetratricopeptide repeat protein [Ktedonosporobacter rubrisoli]|nr:FxSxx-COOH system tetratricopeptide repeat protein [Ktedonosporobacter rubrisoli]
MAAVPWHKRLREERVKRNWRQQELAEKLGTSVPSISRWERGTHQPSAYFRVKLCALFGLSAEELGFVSTQVPFADSEEREVEALSAISDPLLFSPHEECYRNIPFLRNPFFSGREEVLELLHERLIGLCPVALTGLGGIGKTQVAIEYAYRYVHEYEAIFWLAAETAESIMQSLQQVAEAVQLPERQIAEQSSMVQAVRRWLNTHTSWLLVVDNVEDLNLLQTIIPRRHSGGLLFTTRRLALGAFAEALPLSAMNEREGVMLLLRRAKCFGAFPVDSSHSVEGNIDSSGISAAAELVKLLEGLPLALDQAGAYIEETGCSLQDYIQRYQDQRPLVLARRGSHGGAHPDSVTTTLDLSVERVERELPAAANLLRVCAFLHPEAIPEELFAAGASYLGPKLGPMVTDPYQFDQALAALRNVSLLARQPERRTLSVHRLVQAVLQDQMGYEEKRRWGEAIICMVNVAFPVPAFEAWAQCERYLSQALACLPLIELFGRDLQESGELLYKAGTYLVDRSRYAEAQHLLEEAVMLGERQEGISYQAMLSRLTKLATVYRCQGRYSQAEPLLRRVKTLAEAHLGSEHLQTAEIMADLADVYWNQGKYQLVEELQQRVLAIREQHLGATHAQTLNDLAILSHVLGRYKQAEAQFQRALAIQAQQGEADLLQTANILSNLALLYRDLGEPQQAEALMLQALSIRESRLGPRDPDLAQSCNNLASVCYELGKPEQAEALYQRALAILDPPQGPVNPNVAFTLTNLANFYHDQGKDEQAEQLYLRALQIREQQFGPHYPRTATTLRQLAILYSKQGKDELAEPLYHRALVICEQHYGAKHPETAMIYHQLARFYQKRSQMAQAGNLYQRALAIIEQAWGREHSLTREVEADYTRWLKEQGGADAIEQLASMRSEQGHISTSANEIKTDTQ